MQHNATLKSEPCKMILDLFMDYLNVLRNERGQPTAFWMTYIKMVETLLGLLRAD